MTEMMAFNWEQVDAVVKQMKGELTDAGSEFGELCRMVSIWIRHLKELIIDLDQGGRQCDEAIDSLGTWIPTEDEFFGSGLCINQFQRCPSPPPPPGNRGAFAHVVSPGRGAFAILSQPRGLGISIPRGDLWAFDTRVFEIEISFFIGKDEAFVKDWLVHQGLEKLVDVFKGMFSQI